MRYITEQETEFIVIGDSKEEYAVSLNPLSCTCASFRFRSRPVRDNNDLCKHLRFLIKELENENKPSNRK